jgi:hypothetical protein
MGMTQHIESPQPSLLALLMEVPPVVLPSAQQAQLATLVEVLLREIAVALATGEVGHDQDHG